MKKGEMLIGKWVLLLPLLLCVLSKTSLAQQGKFSLLTGIELGLPTGNFSKVYQPGKGLAVKGLLATRTGDQFSMEFGYTSFRIKNDVIDPRFSSDYTIVPVLVGFRRYISRIYSETQMGVGVYTIKVSGLGQSASQSDANFTWAQSFGYRLPHWDFHIRYQQGNLKDAGVEKLTMIGVGAAYQWVFAARKKSSINNAK